MPNVGTISGGMYLDPSGYITGLNQAAQSTQMFQAGVERLSFAGFHRGIFATTTLLYGLNRIMSSMSQGMEEYTNMLGRIGSVADMTAASVEALADSMKKLSVAQGVSRTDIMGGMYTAAQSGFSSPAEMRAMATSGALLSRASGKEIDVKKSVDLLSVARQALGIGQGAVTSNRMTDLLLRGRDVGRWELDEMAQALGIPLTVYGNQFAGKIGGEETLRQLVAIMSTATLAGVNPRMTATGTRRIVERSIQLQHSKRGDELRSALRGIGFKSEDPIGEAMSSPMDYLNTILRLTGGNTSELGRLGFGSRDLMVVTSALRQNGGTLNDLYQQLSYANTSWTTEKYNEKMLQTYDAKRDQLRAQWMITSQEFMQASIPLITGFTNMLGTFNTVAQALPDSLKSFAMLLAALTSFRLALNFLGVRGSIMGAITGVGTAIPLSSNRRLSQAAYVRSFSRFATQPTLREPFGFTPPSVLAGLSAATETRPYRHPETGTRIYGNRSSPIGVYMNEAILRNRSHMPQLVTAAAPFGAKMGAGIAAGLGSGIGAGAGALLGSAMEGPEGGGLTPMIMGSVGAQLGNILPASAMAPAVAAAIAYKMFNVAEWDKNTPMNYAQEQDLARKENLRSRSTNPVLRLLGNVWNSLSPLGMNVADIPVANAFGIRSDDTWASNWFGRIWDTGSRTRAGMFNQYAWNDLDKGSRDYLVKNNMMTAEKVLRNEGFRDYVTQNYGKETMANLQSEDFRISQPQKWLDLLTDSIRGLARSSEGAKAKVDALADAERERAAGMKIADRDLRPYIGFSAGLDTMFGLEGSQRKPFQAATSEDWNKKYDAAFGVYSGEYVRPDWRLKDSDLEARNNELDRQFGGSAPGKVTEVFDKVLAWNQRLRGMDFLGKNGRNLADPGKVSDDAIIAGLGLDANAMGPVITKSVLGKIRGLDYTDWTQTTMQPKAPFSNALQYGTREGYNATLERKDNFAVQIVTTKLGSIVDTIIATTKHTEDVQRGYEERMKKAVSDAADAIVGAINNLSFDNGGFLSTEQ